MKATKKLKVEFSAFEIQQLVADSIHDRLDVNVEPKDVLFIIVPERADGPDGRDYKPATVGGAIVNVEENI